MKRTKFLALALVVAVMMMGAGYAAWTDGASVVSTTTTGDVDLYYNTGVVGFTFNGDNDDFGAVASGSIAYPAPTETSSQATLTLNNVYPGATANATLTIENDSSVPVQFDTFLAPAVVPEVTVTGTVRYISQGVAGNFTLAELRAGSVNFESFVIDANQDITIELDFTVNDVAAENSPYSVNFAPTFKVFNK